MRRTVGAGGLAALLAALLAAGAALPPQAPERPRDPWVFRAALAGVERGVALALHDELWVVYDPLECALRAAWRGHGGGESQSANAAARWLDGSEGGVWWIVRDGRARALEPVWRGYVFRGRQVTLRYELRDGDVRVAVEETPEFVRPSELAEDPGAIAPWVRREMIGLRRTFRATGLPEGAQLCLSLSDRISGNVLSQDLLDPQEQVNAGGVTRRFAARVPLRGADAWNELIYFFTPAAGGGR